MARKKRKPEYIPFKPPIPLEMGRQKIKLRVRYMATTLQKEVGALPQDPRALLKILSRCRLSMNAEIYDFVLAWNKLRSENPKYWETFVCESEAHFLATYMFPDGAKLGYWTVMMELFEKPTFCLLGEEVLLHMMTAVDKYQRDPRIRKRDFSNIFTRYNNHATTFDRALFCSVVREYVVDVYEKPLAEVAGLGHKQWLETKARRGPRKGRVAASMKTSSGVAMLESEASDWRQSDCVYCSRRANMLLELLGYIKRLENVVREKVGESELPTKPPVIAMMERTH